MASASDPADDLFLVPPAEFVAARNQLAAALKKAGQKDQAAAIKALAKPAVSVWAINQVARRHGDAMARFLAASDQLRAAQIAGAATPQSRQEYQASVARQREALAPLLALVEQALAAQGLPAGKPLLDKIANDLRWGAVDEPTRAQLTHGRLREDVAPTDFSALVGHFSIPDRDGADPPGAPVASAARGPAPSSASPAGPRPDEAERLRLRREAEGLRSEVRAARVLAQRARQAIAGRTATHERAQASLAEQERALAKASETAAEAKRALDEATRIATEQDAQVDRLSAALERLEAQLA